MINLASIYQLASSSLRLPETQSLGGRPHHDNVLLRLLMLNEISQTLHLINLKLVSECILSGNRLLNSDTFHLIELSSDIKISWLFRCPFWR